MVRRLKLFFSFLYLLLLHASRQFQRLFKQLFVGGFFGRRILLTVISDIFRAIRLVDYYRFRLNHSAIILLRNNQILVIILNLLSYFLLFLFRQPQLRLITRSQNLLDQILGILSRQILRRRLILNKRILLLVQKLIHHFIPLLRILFSQYILDLYLLRLLRLLSLQNILNQQFLILYFVHLILLLNLLHQLLLFIKQRSLHTNQTNNLLLLLYA